MKGLNSCVLPLSAENSPQHNFPIMSLSPHRFLLKATSQWHPSLNVLQSMSFFFLKKVYFAYY